MNRGSISLMGTIENGSPRANQRHALIVSERSDTRAHQIILKAQKIYCKTKEIILMTGIYHIPLLLSLSLYILIISPQHSPYHHHSSRLPPMFPHRSIIPEKLVDLPRACCWPRPRPPGEEPPDRGGRWT